MAAAAIQPNVRGPVHAVGMYIGGASALLLLCFLADFLHGIRKRKFWLPCAWTTVNALTLSVLAIAIKLPNDISTPMMGGADQLSKLSGTVLTCTFMAVTLPSMGNVVRPGDEIDEEGAVTSMELRANLAGLGVLVVTMVVNVCTQLRTGLISSFRVEHMVVLVATLLCFGYLCSAALAASAFPSTAFPIPSPSLPGTIRWTQDKPRYLMLARTSSKQYVVSRSSIGCVVGALTSISLAMLITAMARTKMAEYVTKSDYGWSIWPILVFQILAILMGWIAICVRWWRPIIFQEQERISLKSSLCQAIEAFWKMTLLKYRLKQGTRKKQLRGLLFRCLQATTIDILLGWQIASVRISKVVLTCCQWLCYCVSVKYKEEKSGYDILQVYAFPSERPLGIWYSNVSQLAQKLHELSSEEGLDITNLCKLLAHAKGNPPTFKSFQVVLKYALTSYSWSLTATSLLTIMKSLEDFYKEVNEKEYCDVEIAFNGLTQASNMIKLIEDMAGDIERNKGQIWWEAAEDVVGGLRFGKFLDFPLNLLHDHARWHPWLCGQLQLLSSVLTESTGREYRARIRDENTEGHFNNAMIILQRLRVTADIKCRLHLYAMGEDMGAYFAWSHLFEVSKAITDLQEEQKIEGFKDLESATNPNEFDDDQWLLLAIIKTALADVVGACLTNLPQAVCRTLWKGSYNHMESVCIEAIRVGDTWCKLWEQLHWSPVKGFTSTHFDLREWLHGQPLDPFIRDDSSSPERSVRESIYFING